MKNFKRLLSLLLVIAIMSSYCIISASADTYDVITNGMTFRDAMVAAAGDNASNIKSIVFDTENPDTVVDSNLITYYECITAGSVIDISYSDGVITVSSKNKLSLDGNVQGMNAGGLFHHLDKLESITGLEEVNTSNASDLSVLFCGCSSLKSVDVSGFNTSNVTAFDAMFQGCYSLTSLDISNFNFGLANPTRCKDMLDFDDGSTTGDFACTSLTLPSILPNVESFGSNGFNLPFENGYWKQGTTEYGMGQSQTHTLVGGTYTYISENYKVKFDGNGATSGEMSNLSLKRNNTQNTPLTTNAYSKTGYTFAGWSEVKDGTVTYADGAVISTYSGDSSTYTLYAKWTPINYNITFNVNDGAWAQGYTATSKYTILDSVTLPTNTNISKTGYTFDGWYDNSGLTGSAITTIAAGSTGDKAYYAKWTATNYSITFNVNDGIWAQGYSAPSGYTVKDSVTLPTKDHISKTGYTFDGWYDNSGFTGTPVTTIATSSTGDKEFWAKWTLNEYDVTFDVDGKTTDGPEAQTINHGGKVEKPNDPEATGYTFGGWYKEAECTNAWNFNTDTVTKATTLYAKWTPETYDITFTVNDGTWAQGYTALDKYTIEDLVTLPTKDNISREGYTFAGWYDNEDFEGNVITTISKGATGDKAFFAKWTLNTYKVTFNTAGKATVEAQTVNHGELSTQPSDPSTFGYVFKGWFEDEYFETPWDFNTPITKDTTIYVKWVKVDSDTPKSDDFSVDNAALEEIAKQFAKESHDVNSSVIVKATVDNNVSKSDKELLESKTDKTLTLFNTSLLLVMDGGTPIDIGDSNDVLVSITYKFDFSKKTNVKTYRVHDGVLDELTETPNEDGEFVKYDKETGTITVVAKKYSTYAFAYDVVEDSKVDTEKKTAENSKEKKETVANTSDNNMIGAFVALSAMSAVAYVSLKKRED